MARRAYLLFTPEMANEQYEFAKQAAMRGLSMKEFVVCENELPNRGDGIEDYVVVQCEPARNGAMRMLLESPQFEDVSGRDYPELPRPRLRLRSEWLKEKAELARRSSQKVSL